MRTKEQISEYNKEYRLNNLDYFKEKHKEYTIIKKDAIAKRKRVYYLENKEKMCEKRKKYYRENKKRLNEQSVKRVNERKREDVLFKLTCNVRALVSSTIKLSGHRKKSRTRNILGCSFEKFKAHLESKFEPWMSWDNYGNWNGAPKEVNVAWDIDHIIPISTAECEEDVIRLNYHTNLTPLCSYINRYIKRNSYKIISHGQTNK